MFDHFLDTRCYKFIIIIIKININAADKYILKVNNRNTRKSMKYAQS